MSYKGIDVSHYNEPTNWDLISSQIEFAILKLGNIGDNNKFWLDDVFEENYRECKRLGIPVGAYVYCYTNSVENARLAGEQARAYLSNIDLDLPVYIDMEDEEIKIEGRDTLTEIVKAFNNEIEKGGDWAGVYANLDWWNNYLNRDELIPRYTSWIAHIDYTNDQDKYAGQYDMFQYSWKGHITGCDGNNGDVDMNIMYRDIINERKGNTPEPASQPTKSIDELAQEVIAGLWGDGEYRKRRLEAAGYDYYRVQGTVNAIYEEETYYPACDSAYTSLVDALKSVGVDSSFANRKQIAVKNGIHDYEGNATQNNQLLAKLKSGRLRK